MLSKILSWLTGGAIQAIGSELNQAYANKLKAETDSEKLDVEKRIATLEAQKSVLLAEQGNWVTRWIRPAFALPFVVYNFKIIVWDKVLGLGTTDPLSTEFWQLQMIVFGAYFLTRPFEKR